MKRILLLGIIIFMLLVEHVHAQNRTVTGKVTSAEDNAPLPGVSVVIKGTVTGTTTDEDGNYSINTSGNGTVLVFTFIGMATEEMLIESKSVMDVSMLPDIHALSEIVVTAVGIERQKREIGYGVQEIKAIQIEQKSEPNVLNALQGKLAGVEIISSSGMPGSSTQVFIRGLSSATGNNQALFVIDGIPMDNSTSYTSSPTVGGAAYSNRGLDLNPNDIESITVLKGPAAAALYGSRAGNGALIITTKKGKAGEFKVAVTSSFNYQEVYGLPKYQNDFGQGVNFRYNGGGTDSWGPRFGTPGITTVPSVAGSPVPPQEYKAYPNNVKDFFKQGQIFDNGISLSGGQDKVTYFFSANSTNQTGIMTNTGLDRLSLRGSGTASISESVSVDASILYVRTNQKGINQGNSGSSPWFTLPFIPRSLNLMELPYKDAPGVQTASVFTSNNRDNPLWAVNENKYTSNVERTVTSASFHYKPQFIKGLSFTYRAGLDQYSDNRLEAIAYGSYNSNGSTATNRKGSEIYDNIKYNQFNQDLFALYTKDISSNFGIRLLIGTQLNEIKSNSITIRAEDLITPEFYHLSNHTNTSIFPSQGSVKRRLMGVYGQLGLSFKNWAFVEFQARNDWSSTLPIGKNSYFYPAASLGVVFTDALNISGNFLSYGKIRGNVAQVGSDAGAYLTKTVYVSSAFGNNVSGITFPFNGTTASSSRSNRKGSEDLVPESKLSYEVGAELDFFRGRAVLDVNYFTNSTTQQIFNVTVPGSTGFTTQTQNNGQIDNKGIEGTLTIKLINPSKSFKWNISANYTRIRNKVVELAPGLTEFTLLTGGGGAGFSGLSPALVKDMPFGVIQGTTFLRNDDGKFVINPNNGLPIVDTNPKLIGDPNPDWWGGLTNSFGFKGFSLEVVVQYIQGGDVYSRQTQVARLRGVLEETGGDRERPYMFQGVLGTVDGTPTAVPNNIQITASDYWAALNSAAEFAVFDASVLRLRELSLGYSIPSSLLKKSPFQSASLTLTGRNLFYYAPNMPHADPGSNQLGGNTRGFEFNSPPSVRNYGVNLKFTF